MKLLLLISLLILFFHNIKAQSFSCPTSTKSPTKISATGSISISIVPRDTLCTLTLKQIIGDEEALIPLARSYDNNDWETVAGPHPIKFSCSGSLCQSSTLPTIEATDSFQLTTFKLNDRSITSADVAARFLEQASFGPTRESLAQWKDLPMASLDHSFATWTYDQINSVPMTSHRQYLRKRTQSRTEKANALGIPSHPCTAGSRWHTYAFTTRDSNMIADRHLVTRSKMQVRQVTGDTYALYVNNIVRTEVQGAPKLWGNTPFSGTQEFCYNFLEEKVGGMVGLRSAGCLVLLGGNPRISFFSQNSELPPLTISLTPQDFSNKFKPIPGSFNNEEFILTESLTEAKCNDIGPGDYPVYVNFGDGNFMAFDPRIQPMENTVENPLVDGGGQNKYLGAKCSNAPRTFLNAHGCRLSSHRHSCNNNNEVKEDRQERLTPDKIRSLYTKLDRYVYAVRGLRPNKSPCELGTTSRWERLGTASSCSISASPTHATLSNRLESFSSLENDLREITMLEDTECDIPSTTPSDSNQVKVIAQSSCWGLVHPNHHDVYDMTPWVTLHPGGTEKITAFADNGSVFLDYPSHHEMSRWESNKSVFGLPLGVYNQITNLRDFPDGYKFRPLALEIFGTYPETSTNVVVCGSPNEVTNDMNLVYEGNFQIEVGFWDAATTIEDKGYQRNTVWTKIAMHEDDQLRQRVAFALSHIFAIQPVNILTEYTHTEGFVSYYDIFVRHAFGNYFDVLKEVSYSGFMAEMLTYLFSKSSAFQWDREEKKFFADENYAREIMQLFTMGTIMLNMDGTPVIDPETGAPQLSYTNEHIMSFARAWTGFNRQESRANIDQGFNRIDPMFIEIEWRDVFPKIDLKNGFIGDGYPLCTDMPKRSYLRKGAQYQLLGVSTTLEMHRNPDHRQNVDPLLKFASLDTNSNLYDKLCQPTSNGGNDCIFPGLVTLTENLDCVGQECAMDTLRYVEVANGIFYEYVRQPCVQFPFYENAKKIMWDFRHMEMCGDPRMDIAGAACCSRLTQDWEYENRCEYIQERVTFATASQRCADNGQALCKEPFMAPQDSCKEECCKYSYYFHWHSASCKIQLKVEKGTGKVTIAHKAHEDSVNIPKHLRENNFNFFPVYWTSSYPDTTNNCGDGACEVVSDGCLCVPSVSETAVFSSAPTSVEDILSNLHIGSVSPDTFDDGNYDPPISSGSIKIYHRNGASFNMDTIFEIEHRNEKKFYINKKSIVEIKDKDGNVLFSFRNPPNFNSLLQGDTDPRDAHYETHAVLQEYFYHPNVPPFMAIHFIQRFGISNPSPMYVETVATAFKNGNYVYDNGVDSPITYGTNQYGDLGATIAAVILHREARSLVLDYDPSKGSLKEPLIKVMNVLRAMEYKPFEKYEFEEEIPLGIGPKRYLNKGHRLFDMTEKMGQMVYNPPDIFSFFRREFSPSGPVRKASLVAPEGQRYSTTKTIGLINGFLSLFKFGLSDCHAGFGPNMRHFTYYCNDEGTYVNSYGKVMFNPENGNNARDVVDEMATLLTAGRLNEDSRNIIANQIGSDSVDDAELRIAQQLMVVTPEFHSTSLIDFNGEERKRPEQEPMDPNKPYKAVVFLMLEGGFDSYNLLVPLSECSKDMYNEYARERGAAGLPFGYLLGINTGKHPQVCSRFGVHSSLPVLKNLYDASDLIFLANTGVLFEPVTKEDWDTKSLTQLFAHNVQQRETQQVDPYGDTAGAGVLGRMADALTRNSYSTGSFSISGETFSLLSEGDAPSINQIDPWIDPVFNPKPSRDGLDSVMFDLNNPSLDTSGFYGKTWADTFEANVKQTEELKQALDNANTGIEFPNTLIGNSLERVANVVKMSSTLKHNRQLFHVKDVLYDWHGLPDRYGDEILGPLNDAIDSFVKEMKAINMWDNVLLVMASDFGRTLTPNTAGGTDHGWGGNYFVLGGPVQGGEILGQYPDDLTQDAPLNVGRGRFIPTTSWDAVWNPISEWMGVGSNEDLDRILPNRNNFELITSAKMFGSTSPTQNPTAGPTKVPPLQPIWYPVAGQGGEYDSIGDSMTDAEFRQIWSTSPNKILRRLCSACTSASHREIYYRRFDSNGELPTDFDLLETVKNTWVDKPNNEFNIHFALYSTYSDALNDSNRWTYCNFSSILGFPRDCGPTGFVGSQWNNFQNHNHGFRAVGFYVETPTDTPPTGTPTKSPTKTPTKSPTKTPTESPTKNSGDPPSPTRSPTKTVGELWFVDKGKITLNLENNLPRMTLSHAVGLGADGMKVNLFKADCLTPIPTNDPVKIDDSQNILADGEAKYTITFDKANLGGSQVMVGEDLLHLCVNLELEDTASNLVVVSRKSRIEVSFDMTYALFFLTVNTNGATVDEFDVDDLALFTINACVCLNSFICDSTVPVMEENSAISVCLTPSSPGVKFKDFNMVISNGEGFSFSPITTNSLGQQELNSFTTIEEEGFTWKVTTQLVTGLFQNEANQAEINGGGLLEFSNARTVNSSETKEFSVTVALKAVENSECTSFFGILEDIFDFFWSIVKQFFSIFGINL